MFELYLILTRIYKGLLHSSLVACNKECFPEWYGTLMTTASSIMNVIIGEVMD